MGSYQSGTLFMHSMGHHQLAAAARSQFWLSVKAAADTCCEDRNSRRICFCRAYFADAEAGVDFLDKDARWPVW